jgi:hypothetical protein
VIGHDVGSPNRSLPGAVPLRTTLSRAAAMHTRRPLGVINSRPAHIAGAAGLNSIADSARDCRRSDRPGSQCRRLQQDGARLGNPRYLQWSAATRCAEAIRNARMSNRRSPAPPGAHAASPQPCTGWNVARRSAAATSTIGMFDGGMRPPAEVHASRPPRRQNAQRPDRGAIPVSCVIATA